MKFLFILASLISCSAFAQVGPCETGPGNNCVKDCTEETFVEDIKSYLKSFVGKKLDNKGSKILSVTNLILNSAPDGDDDETSTKYEALFTFNQTDLYVRANNDYDQVQWHNMGYVKYIKQGNTCKMVERTILGDNTIHFEQL